jgi:hypothetical protein
MTDPKSADPELTERQLVVLSSVREAIKGAPVPVRSCGDCAKCCEGWLAGSVFGHDFSSGTPCFFLEKTCSIYPDRPMNPCRNYQCAWLAEDIFPMWMKPSLANLIITRIERHQSQGSHRYYVVDQAGDAFDPRALNWLLNWAASTQTNLECRLNGNVQRIGSPEFMRSP